MIWIIGKVEVGRIREENKRNKQMREKKENINIRIYKKIMINKLF